MTRLGIGATESTTTVEHYHWSLPPVVIFHDVIEIHGTHVQALLFLAVFRTFFDTEFIDHGRF